MADAANPGAEPPAQSQGQSPPGSSPATTPVPNRGQEAAALAGISVIANALIQLVPKIGPSTDIGKDVLKAAQMLLKHVPPGTVAPGVQNSAMQNMQREQAGQQPMSALLAARGGQPGGQPAAAQPGAQAAA